MATRHELESKLTHLVDPLLAEDGLELVELAVTGAAGRQVLRLSIDRAGSAGVALEDCQRISRKLSSVLDETEPIPNAFVLEVSSPGIDRPIRTADDIRRNTGRFVLVTAKDGTGRERAYRGTLIGLEDQQLRLSDEAKEEIRIALKDVVSARQEVSFDGQEA